MDYKIRLFTAVEVQKQHVSPGSHGDTNHYSHVDIHLGNLLYEMEKSLTVEQMNEFTQKLQMSSNRKAHEAHMRNLKK
jgi:hypothetical protein